MIAPDDYFLQGISEEVPPVCTGDRRHANWEAYDSPDNAVKRGGGGGAGLPSLDMFGFEEKKPLRSQTLKETYEASEY
ncbi:unnamed protein product [Boreogadus saida]